MISIEDIAQLPAVQTSYLFALRLKGDIKGADVLTDNVYSIDVDYVRGIANVVFYDDQNGDLLRVLHAIQYGEENVDYPYSGTKKPRSIVLEIVFFNREGEITKSVEMNINEVGGARQKLSYDPIKPTSFNDIFGSGLSQKMAEAVAMLEVPFHFYGFKVLRAETVARD